MQRRVGRKQSVKRRRRAGSKARKAGLKGVSPGAVKEPLAALSREVKEAREQQAATDEVLSIMRRSPADAQPVFDAIVQSATRICEAMFSVVYLYDGDHLRIRRTKTLHSRPLFSSTTLSSSSGPTAHTLAVAPLDRAVVHIPDVLEDPEYSGNWHWPVDGVLSFCSFASRWEGDGRHHGSKAAPTPFSDRQVQLLKTFADQAVIAIGNVRLFETEQRRTRELPELEQQTATSKVLGVISSSPTDVQPVFETIASNSVNLCGAGYCIVYSFDGEMIMS